MAESAPWTFCQNNTVMLTYLHNHAPGILLWHYSCHRNEKQNSESFFNYDANLTSVITMELKLICFSLRCWFLCMTSLAVTSSMLKTSVKFEVLLLNSGYAPGDLKKWCTLCSEQRSATSPLYLIPLFPFFLTSLSLFSSSSS